MSTQVINVALLHKGQGGSAGSDKISVTRLQALYDLPTVGRGCPWIMQMRAVSHEEPNRLIRVLTGPSLDAVGGFSAGVQTTPGV